MNKKAEITEKLIKLYDNAFNYYDKITNDIINFYYSRYNMIEQELKYLNSNKPLKIYKNKYKKWLKEKEELENEKFDVLKKISEEIKDLSNFL